MRDPRVLFAVMVAFVFHKHRLVSGYFELVEELGCQDTEFRLSCGSLEATMAILEATFDGNDSFLEPVNSSCGNSTSFRTEKEINFRHLINRRCSGVNYCSYVLSEDEELASKWGAGAVYLRYACMDDDVLTKSCNSDLDADSEGFVQTPGYPRYYVGGRTCRWTVKTIPPRRIRLEFLDISLRAIGSDEKKCSDWLVVSEDGSDLFSGCGDPSGNVIVRSSGPVLNVTLTTTSKKIFPKRGLLFHYKAIGCPAIQKPRDGYIVYRNETFVHLRCCIGFVFPEIMERDLTVRCINENSWDRYVPDCINVTGGGSSGSLSNKPVQHFNKNSSVTALPASVMEETDVSKDFIVPAVIMGLLFAGNGILLLVILHYRKKLTSGRDSVSQEMHAKILDKT